MAEKIIVRMKDLVKMDSYKIGVLVRNKKVIIEVGADEGLYQLDSYCLKILATNASEIIVKEVDECAKI